MARIKTSVGTDEMQGPEAPDVTMPRSGDFTRDDVPVIEQVADVRGNSNKYLEDIAFDNELVTIRLYDTNDPNDEPRVPVQVNGEKAHPVYGNHLPRGIELQVKRMVAAVLARSKPISVKTVKTVDYDGNDTAKIVRSVGTRYPFELVNAKPKDVDWLRKIRAEA